VVAERVLSGNIAEYFTVRNKAELEAALEAQGRRHPGTHSSLTRESAFLLLVLEPP
jgi:hypothetical protein